MSVVPAGLAAAAAAAGGASGEGVASLAPGVGRDARRTACKLLRLPHFLPPDLPPAPVTAGALTSHVAGGCCRALM